MSTVIESKKLKNEMEVTVKHKTKQKSKNKNQSQRLEGTQKPCFWLLPPIFPNEIFGDLLYKLSSATTVNRYIIRNATGPDRSSS